MARIYTAAPAGASSCGRQAEKEPSMRARVVDPAVEELATEVAPLAPHFKRRGRR
jgi:hypothetical protein